MPERVNFILEGTISEHRGKLNGVNSESEQVISTERANSGLARGEEGHPGVGPLHDCEGLLYD